MFDLTWIELCRDKMALILTLCRSRSECWDSFRLWGSFGCNWPSFGIVDNQRIYIEASSSGCTHLVWPWPQLAQHARLSFSSISEQARCRPYGSPDLPSGRASVPARNRGRMTCSCSRRHASQGGNDAWKDQDRFQALGHRNKGECNPSSHPLCWI